MNEQEAIEGEVVEGPGEQAEQLIDGDRTAKRKLRVNPNDRNWVAIKRSWCLGESVPDICEQYGIHRQSLYRKASVAKWPRRVRHNAPARKPLDLANQTEQPIKETVQAAVQEQVTQQMPTIALEVRKELGAWFKRVVATSNRLHDHIDAKVESKLEVEEIKSLSLSLASIDTTVRRTFGLDSTDGRNLGVLASCRASVECPFEPAPQAVAAAPSGDGGGQVASGGNGS